MIGHPRPKSSKFAGSAVAVVIMGLCARGLANEPTDPRTGDHIVDRTHETMGTIAHIEVWGNDDENIVRAIDEAFTELDRIDRVMTTWKPDTEISQINAGAGSGKPVPVSDEVLAVIQRAQETSKMSNGLFD